MPQFGTVIDPVQSPAAANAAVESILREPAPLLPSPPPNTVKLFYGLNDPDEGLCKEARIRELNGEDEERIARSTQDVTVENYREKFIEMILVGNVEEIGDAKRDRQALRNLLIGDRAHLALEIRKLTFGNDWPIEGMTCRLCGQTFDVVIELDKDVIYREMVPTVMEDAKIPVPLRNGTALVRLVNGHDQFAALDGGPRTLPEQTTIYIDRCLVSIDGNPVSGLAKKMGSVDRNSIVKALAENAPGPRLDAVKIPCSRCNKEAEYAISIVDLFRF